MGTLFISVLPVLQRFVEKLRWMSHDVFIELYALGSCLPGPSSTQVSFAIGTIKQGISGARAVASRARARLVLSRARPAYVVPLAPAWCTLLTACL
jgi:hypothetical protein